MKLSRPLSCSVLLVVAGAASAQSPAVLSKDDAEFAQKLFEAGYTDLARSLTDLLGKSGGNDDVATLKVKILNLNLRIKEAREEPDPLTRKQRFMDLVAEKRALIEEFPRSKEAQEERNSMPDLYREVGEALAAALDKEEDPEKAKALREEGEKIFEEAKAGLQRRIREFKDIRASVDPDAPEASSEYADNQLMIARYNEARTYYFNARLYPKGNPNKNLLLVTSVRLFQDFALDYGDQLLAYDGEIYQGLCLKDMEPSKEHPEPVAEAIEAFDAAIGLRETWGYNEDTGVYQIDEADGANLPAIDLISNGLLQKVLLLRDLERLDEAKVAVDDYFKTVPNAIGGRSALASLAALADGLVEAGDVAGARVIAQRLVDVDPNGPWGAKGNEVLGNVGGGGGVSADQSLRVAYEMFRKENFDRAIEFARMAAQSARGTAEQDRIGGDAYITIAAAYVKRGQFQEATLAYDAVADLYPKSEQVPEALYRAATLYSMLNQSEKRAYYRTRKEERQSTLAQQFPNHPRAVEARMLEGEAMEEGNEWVKAAEFYLTFREGTPGYETAQVRAATCFYRLARDLETQKKPDEARPHFQRAEELLTTLQPKVDKVLDETLDNQVVQRLSGVAFNCRALRAQICLEDAINRPGEVEKILADVEQRFGDDPSKLARAWSLRIQALQMQGRLDEAAAKLENLRTTDPDSPAVAEAAGALARAFDSQGVERFEKDPKSREGTDLWKRAAGYYWIAIQPQLRGAQESGEFDSERVEAVARRLFVMGLQFNEVPETVDTFVGLEKAVAQPTCFEQAARLFDTLRTRPTSYENVIFLARCHGFLADWKAAASVYAELMEAERPIEPGSKRFSDNVIRTRGKLIAAYLEWAVCEQLAGAQTNDKERLARAEGMFSTLLENSSSESRLWWGAQVYLLRNLFAQGEYDSCAVLLRQVERTTNPEDAKKFGYDQQLKTLKSELAKLGFASAGASERPKGG